MKKNSTKEDLYRKNMSPWKNELLVNHSPQRREEYRMAEQDRAL
jgi:hypothetical protein